MEYLNDLLTIKLIIVIEAFIQTEVQIPRIKYGKKQTLETLINEEALLLAKFLRSANKIWSPRMPRFRPTILKV